MRVLSLNDVKEIFTMCDAIEAVETACAENVKGNMETPNKIHIVNNANNSDTLFMPARLSRMGIMGLKIISRVPNNVNKGLPTSIGMVIIFDDLTGLPLLAMEAGYLTNIRTGALTGVACKHLARPDSTKLAIIGTGVQAQTQALAIAEVLNIGEIRIYSRKPERVCRFIRTMEASLAGINFIPATSGEEAVRGADVVVCATSAINPVLFRDWIAPGTCVCAIGTYNTSREREVDSETLRDASIIVADCRKAVLAFGGDVIIPLKEGVINEAQVIDLGELVLGTKNGRQSASEITFFKSVGFAGVDISIGKKLFEKAKELDVGIEVPLYPDEKR